MDLLSQPVGVTHYLIVAAMLFVAGVVCMATKRNGIGVLMGVELVLNGANLNFVAFSSECPHLGCGVNLAADGKNFSCPCHNSAFTLAGKPVNDIPPRPMDRLEVRLSDDDDPKVRVRFRRFRSQAKEQIPLA